MWASGNNLYSLVVQNHVTLQPSSDWLNKNMPQIECRYETPLCSLDFTQSVTAQSVQLFRIDFSDGATCGDYCSADIAPSVCTLRTPFIPVAIFGPTWDFVNPFITSHCCIFHTGAENLYFLQVD